MGPVAPYNPDTAFFTTQDTNDYLDNPVNGNRYAYADDNPVNYIDPTGHFSWGDTLTGLGILGGTELLECNRRRTARRGGQVSAAVRELAGRAGSHLLRALGIGVSQHVGLRAVLAICLPGLELLRVLGDDFALWKGLIYAAVLIDAATGPSVDSLEGRIVEAAEGWIREHPDVEVVTRGGSGAYGEAVRRTVICGPVRESLALMAACPRHRWPGRAPPTPRSSLRVGPRFARTVDPACEIQLRGR